MSQPGLNWTYLVATTSESTYGTQNDPPTATDFFRVTDGIQITAEKPLEAQPDFGRSRTMSGAIEGVESTTFTLPLVLRPSGTPGTVPGFDQLLLDTHFADSTDNTADTVQASPSPTATGFDIGTGGNVTVNTFVVVDGTGYAKPEVRFCTANSSGSLTITPALSAAPTAADDVGATNTWALRQYRSGSFTMFGHLLDNAGNGLHSDVLPGCVSTTWGITWSVDSGYLTAEWSGQGSGEYIHTEATTLGAAIADGTTTTITLSELGAVSVGSAILIESEALEVTAKSADTGSGTCTVTRGYNSTSGVAHSDSTPVYPYLPSPTIPTATPVSALYCDVFIGATAVELQATSVSISISENATMLRDASTENGRASDFSTGMRTVTVTIEGYFTSANAANLFQGRSATSYPILIQWGKTLGKIFAIYLPEVYLQSPDIDTSGDGPTTFTITGEARGSSEDELYFGQA